MDDNSENKVTIIGGGVAGLTAAIFLAQNGGHVTLYEQGKKLGGRAKTTNKDGVLFNMGAHALYVGGAADKTFQEVGIKLSGKRPVFAKSIGVRDGRDHILPGTPAELFKTDLINFKEKINLARYLMKIQSGDAGKFSGISWQEWVEDLTDSKRLRQMIIALSRVFTYTNDPERVSAQVILSQMQMGLKENVRYLDGGWQSMVQALREKAEGFGTDIVTESRITAIDPSENSVTLVDGAKILSGAIVLAVDPQTASKLLPESASLAQFIGQNIPVKTAALNLAFSKLPCPDNQFSLGIDHSSFFSVHSHAAKLTPDGTIVAHLMKYYPADDEDGDRALQELEHVLDLIQPGWKTFVIERSYLPVMTAANHLPTAEQGGYNGRPAVQLPEYDNIFLTGDWVGDEGWLVDGSVASGRKAAKLISHQLAGISAHQPVSQ